MALLNYKKNFTHLSFVVIFIQAITIHLKDIHCNLSDAPKPLVFAHLYAHKLEQQESLRPIIK